jgi:hypothetical protein
MEKIKKTLSFSSFNEQQVIRTFDLKQERKINLLSDWQGRAEAISLAEVEKERLKELHQRLNLFVRGWNEEELKLKFIEPIIELVAFDNFELEIIAFSERPISMQFGDTQVKGIVDTMVAKGLYAPEQPFFFIHVKHSEIPKFGEYKREQESTGDPLGQLLATMVVAQKLNEEPQNLSLFQNELKDYSTLPKSGVYVLGRTWIFVILEDNQYHLSKSYDSTDLEDLFEIVKLLKAQKEIILEIMRRE